MTEQTAPTDPRTAALQQAWTQAELRQKLATSRAAALAAHVPSVGDAPSGTTTLGEGAGGLGVALAHEALARAAQDVADAVREQLPKDAVAHVVVVDDLPSAVATALGVHRTLTSAQARLVRASEVLDEAVLAATATEAPQGDAADGESDYVEPSGTTPLGPTDGTSGAPGTGPLPGALGAALGLAALVRSDFSVSAIAVSAGAEELQDLVTVALAQGGKGKDRAFLTDADRFGTTQQSTVWRELEAVATAREDLAGQAQRASLLLALAQPAGRAGAVGPDLRDAAALTVLVKDAVALLTEVDELVSDLGSSTGDGDAAPAVTAARLEAVVVPTAGADDTDRPVRLVHLAVDTIAADAVSRRSLLRSPGVVTVHAVVRVRWAVHAASTAEEPARLDGGHVNLHLRQRLLLDDGTVTEAEEVKPTAAVAVPTDRLEQLLPVLLGAVVLFLVLYGIASLVAAISGAP